jgi:hypothetical protein
MLKQMFHRGAALAIFLRQKMVGHRPSIVTVDNTGTRELGWAAGIQGQFGHRLAPDAVGYFAASGGCIAVTTGVSAWNSSGR